MADALALLVPGQPLREGLERILLANRGALIAVGDGPDVLSICTGGFLIDAETRLNPAAASTYYGASGSPQSGGRADVPPAPIPRRTDQAPADQGKPDSGEPKAEPAPRVAAAAPEPEDLKNIEQLPEADRPLAIKQRICPVTGAALGSMGVPVKITLRGQTVFLCCKGCIGQAKRSPDEILKKLADAAPAVEHH